MKPELETASLTCFMRTPDWIVAVSAAVLMVMASRRDISMIHPPADIVDQRLLPPDLATIGMLLLMA